MMTIFFSLIAILGSVFTGGKIALYMLKHEMLPGFEYLSEFIN